jgi:hypothetical protein
MTITPNVIAWFDTAIHLLKEYLKKHGENA